MNGNVKEALHTMLANWKAMSADNADAEASANEFEASFYLFIDAVRRWVYKLEPQPQTMEEFFQLPLVEEIIEVLPEPLQLNFETEAEYILDNKTRIDDEKYD